MKNLLEYLLIHIVDHPEDVSIDEEIDDRGSLYILHVHADDMGKVIGKSGSVIDAIRKIAKIRAVKEGIRVTITLAEAVNGQVAAAPSDDASDEAAA